MTACLTRGPQTEPVSETGSVFLNGPNIGQKDDPQFIATEQRWNQEIATAADRFHRAAEYFVGLERAARAADAARKAAGWAEECLSPEHTHLVAESRRYRERFGEIAEVEVRNYAVWVLAGKPREWTPPYAVGGRSPTESVSETDSASPEGHGR